MSYIVNKDLVERVREATIFSYEAGEYPKNLDQDVVEYISGDGGLLNSLDELIFLLETFRNHSCSPRDALDMD